MSTKLIENIKMMKQSQESVKDDYVSIQLEAMAETI